MLTSRRLRNIAKVQNCLNDFGVIQKTLNHMERRQDIVVQEYLAFLSAILFNANIKSQVKSLSPPLVLKYYFSANSHFPLQFYDNKHNNPHNSSMYTSLVMNNTFSFSTASPTHNHRARFPSSLERPESLECIIYFCRN